MNQEIFVTEIRKNAVSVTLSEGIETLKIKLDESIGFKSDNGFFKKGNIHRFEVKVDDISPVHWLKAQKFKKRFYWKDRWNGLILAGVGLAECKSYEEPTSISFPIKFNGESTDSSGNLFYMGTGRFNSECELSEEWKLFGRWNYYLPLFELRKENGETILACNIAGQGEGYYEKLQNARIEIDQLKSVVTEFPVQLPSFNGTSLNPSFEQWQSSIEKLLEFVSHHEFEKAVLARTLSKIAECKLDAVDLIIYLAKNNANTYHFCIQLDDHLAFIGASPEQLFHRNHRHVRSEALAGTRPRGKTKKEDDAFAEELLNSGKDCFEQEIVTQRITEKLSKLCRDLQFDKDRSIRRLGNVQHLQTGIKGELLPGITDSDILKTLHPTPAVCGYPTDKALERIRQYEEFDRGLYAGIVGCFGKDITEVSVGLRSALVNGSTLTLYAGSGIVNGSNSLAEWEETEFKMQSFSNILDLSS